MSYQSPIDVIYGDMEVKFENEVFKAIQSVDICVEREELIKALEYDRQQYDKGYADGKADANNWIPCSERLPESTGFYLITAIDDRADSWVALYKNNEWRSVSGLPIEIKNVTAWMPLPEPYQEADDDTE